MAINRTTTNEPKLNTYIVTEIHDETEEEGEKKGKRENALIFDASG